MGRNFKLKAFNRTISKTEPLREFGAEISKTIDKVVKDSDFIITILTDAGKGTLIPSKDRQSKKNT